MNNVSETLHNGRKSKAFNLSHHIYKLSSYSTCDLHLFSHHLRFTSSFLSTHTLYACFFPAINTLTSSHQHWLAFLNNYTAIKRRQYKQYTLLTRWFVVLQGNHKLGALLQAFKEIDHQVSNILTVGTLECELFTSDSGKSKGLGVYFLGLATRHGGNFWEGQLQKHLLLIIHNINTCPVHSNDHIILGQVGSGVPGDKDK